MSTLLHDLDRFVADTGLSEHRVGILVAKNGRLIPRLRDGCRIWPETEQNVRDTLEAERVRRGLVAANESGAAT